MENIMLCSFAHPECSPHLQGFLHEGELCRVVLACHCPLDVLFSFVRIERLSESRVGHGAFGKSSDDAEL